MNHRMGLIDLVHVPTVIRALGVYLLVFGIVTIAGGVVGFVKAKSRASLVAGSIAGVLLLIAGYLVRRQVHPGVILGLLVSTALAGRFGVAFAKSRKVMPAGVILVLSVGAIALSMAALAAWSS